MSFGDPYGFKRAQSIFGGHRRPSREPDQKVSPGKILSVHEYECEGCGCRSYIQEGLERAFPCSECGEYKLARRVDYGEAEKAQGPTEEVHVQSSGPPQRRPERVHGEGSRQTQPRLLDDMGAVLAMAVLCVLIGLTALHPVISVVNGCCAGAMLGTGWMTILRRVRRRTRWAQ